MSAAQDTARLPHDASVFVGSLPSNVDQAELTRLLMNHLCGHAEIKNIKVVRDSKGGVCAFVQCQNATAASALIDTLRSSSPKPFLGRILRYEPARAFRTLIISYRSPSQFITSPDDPQHLVQYEPELPISLRIWKHCSTRFYKISYNSHAEEVDSTVTDTSVLLNPLTFTEESLYAISSYFGSLESFKTLHVPAPFKGDSSNLEWEDYPYPHNAPREDGMSTACWEVKWQHRNDCVSALMTLRRVPHLTVTWAHQPASANYHTRQQQQGLYPLHVQWPYEESELKSSPASNYSPPVEDYSTTERNASDSISGDESTATYSFKVASQNQAVVGLETPALDPVAITPSNVDSQFSITQAPSVAEALPKPQGNYYRSEHIIDPTTLFVGGLEMHGPRAWDEAKVRDFFSRYSGLESVKFVRPAASTSAFAFVKFNNTESPARAVSEEHNRVFEGRSMRVQLRDCNPRANWKNGKGRGRAPANFLFNQKWSNPSRNEPIVLSSEDGPIAEAEYSNISMDASSGSVGDIRYREWYDAPDSPMATPAPSTVGPPQYTPGGGYLPPPPQWVAPYPPFPMPYYAPMLPGSEVGPAMVPAWPSVGVYGSFIPYPVLPPVDSGGVGQGPSGFVQHEYGRPPVYGEERGGRRMGKQWSR